MVDTPPDRPPPSWAARVFLDTSKRDEAFAILRQTTVYFTDLRGRPQALGSGVIVCMFNRTFIFTVGHVVRLVKDALANETVHVSVNRSRGSLKLSRETICIRSPGDAQAIDAGVLLLTPDNGIALTEFGGFAPARASALRPNAFSNRRWSVDEYIVCGFPGAKQQMAVKGHAKYIEQNISMEPFVGLLHAERFDRTHLWLDAREIPYDPATNAPVTDASFSGVSGGGCWIVEPDEQLQQLSFALVANHSATVGDLIREVPVFHTLQLLRASTGLRREIDEKWPELATMFEANDASIPR